MGAWVFVFQILLLGVVGMLIASFAVPLLLALITYTRQRQHRKQEDYSSSILVGRVWHTRHQPKRHAFTYPLFMFRLNLNKDVEKSSSRPLVEQHLWPLSLIMSFNPGDHLINGEGGGTSSEIPLSQRICNLVSERTNKKCKPTTASHDIFLVTHLSYYGYCFNPVSFFYVIDRNTRTTEVIVAEVSNTPWLEMHAYVLHADSTDKVKVNRREQSTNFVFPKNFHVSPFMEMCYDYDWIFDDWSMDQTRVVTAMNGGDERNILQFSATMNVKANGLNPFVLAWQLARYPVYCFIIQIWIHYEAFWLFLKGIVFQPHPTGAETTASRIIGDLMTPLFAVKDYLDGTTAAAKTKKIS